MPGPYFSGHANPETVILGLLEAAKRPFCGDLLVTYSLG